MASGNQITVFSYDYSTLKTYYYENSVCSNSTMVTSGPDATYSILAGFRAGFVHEFFDPSFKFKNNHFNYYSAVYQGLGMARGINAPKWTYFNLVRNGTDGNLYTFNASVYFFPENWVFPLRNQQSGVRTPLRIELNGVYSNGIDTAPYIDTWDLFQYYPGAPNASVFSPCALDAIPVAVRGPLAATTGGVTTGPVTTGRAPTSGVANSLSTGQNIGAANQGSDGLSGGAKAGIAIAVIVFVVGVGAGAFVYVRKQRRGGGGGRRQGDAGKGFAQMNEDDQF